MKKKCVRCDNKVMGEPYKVCSDCHTRIIKEFWENRK